MTYALLISTCYDYRNKLQMCFRTWLKNFDPQQVYIFADYEKKFHNFDVLKYTDNGSYFLQAIKFVKGAIQIKKQYDYYVYSQEDYYINKYMLQKKLLEVPKDVPFIGGFKMLYRGGPKQFKSFQIVNVAVIFNKLAFKMIINFLNDMPLSEEFFNTFAYDGYATDVLWSYAAHKLNIKLTDLSCDMVRAIQENMQVYDFIVNGTITTKLRNYIAIHLHSYSGRIGAKNWFLQMPKFKKLQRQI